MLRLTLLAGLMSLLFTASPAQNLLPNAGFESYSSCPSALGQLDGRLNNWNRANTATPDYANCGYSGNFAVTTTPRTGSGAVGMWAGASHPSCSSTGYSEAIRANLTSPLVAGQTYDVEIAARVDGVGSSTAGPNNCMDLGMYFYNSATPPAANGWCCFSVTPQWRIPGGNMLSGTYILFSGTFVAAGNYDRVILGGFCNSVTGGSSCATYSSARMYWNLDDARVQSTVVLSEGDLHLDGSALLDFNQLNWEMPAAMGYTALYLERSSDGNAFRVIHEVYPGMEDYQFSYRDESPLEGANHYRVAAVDANGQRFTSEVLTLQHGFSAPTTPGVLNYAFDGVERTVRFQLDAGQGGDYRLQVLDLSGRQVDAFRWSVGPGEQDFQFPVGQHAKGVYVLRLQSESTGQVWQNKLVNR